MVFVQRGKNFCSPIDTVTSGHSTEFLLPSEGMYMWKVPSDDLGEHVQRNQQKQW